MQRSRLPGWVWVAVVFTAAVAALGGRYGFHRDELYLVEAGRHPALAHPDQPALVPLLARAAYGLVGGSLPAFRLVPALAGGLVVVVAALTARELGHGRRDQTWAAVVVGTSTTMFVAAHLFGTTVFDVLLTATTLLLLLRALRLGGPGPWLVTGFCAALALGVKTLPATVLACALLALVLVGPRAVLRSRWPYAAAGLALLGLTPTLWWQQANGWPQLAMAAAIADGGSGTSVDRALLLPLLLTLTGPPTAAVLVVGAVALWRRRELRWAAVTAGLLVVVLLLTGGKPYYLMGVVPLLVAEGVPACLRWAARRRGRGRGLAAVVVLNGVVGAFVGLPLLPAALAPVAVVYDHGEQVGWEELVDTVAGAASDSDAELVLTGNYGQAGALDRARGQGVALPPVVSGHNGYWWWGPPDGEPATVVAVGRWSDADLARWFSRCEQVASVSNAAGVDNDEAGTPVRTCSGPRGSWADLWPDLKRLG